MKKFWVVIVVCAACGNSSNHDGPGVTVDAAPDSDPDPGPPVTGDHHHYIVDHVTIPNTTGQAMSLGLDLDGDGTVDNQLGAILASNAQLGFDVSSGNSAAIDRGTLLMLVDLQADSLTASANAGVQTRLGTNPEPLPCTNAGDTTCRHHLAGTGMFGVDPALPPVQLEGPLSNGVFSSTSTGGKMSMWVAPFGALMRFDLVGARIQLQNPSDLDIASGVIAGGVTLDDLHAQYLPALAAVMEPIVQTDCLDTKAADCGCGVGSAGATLITTYDNNHDCAITTSDLLASELIQQQLAPDLTIGSVQAVSFAIGITAVKATFTP